MNTASISVLADPWRVLIGSITAPKNEPIHSEISPAKARQLKGQRAAVEAAKRRATSNRAAILAAIAEKPMSIGQLMHRLGLARETLRNALAKLKEEQSIEPIRITGVIHWRLWK